MDNDGRRRMHPPISSLSTSTRTNESQKVVGKENVKSAKALGLTQGPFILWLVF